MKKIGYILVGCLMAGIISMTTTSFAKTLTEIAMEDNRQNVEKVKVTPTLMVMNNEVAGEYLADTSGRTLYIFKNDTLNMSSASGEVLKKWPPYVAENFMVPTGYNADDFSTIIREDTGISQVTYKGFPLYYFADDKMQGDTKGYGIKNVWYTVNSSMLTVLTNETAGEYLADAEGRALYIFKNDEVNKSNASSEVLKKWPPYLAQNFIAPPGYDKNDFGVIIREDMGFSQVTYKGHPLYYFVNDKMKGDTKGYGIRNVWYTLNSKSEF